MRQDDSNTRVFVLYFYASTLSCTDEVCLQFYYNPKHRNMVCVFWHRARLVARALSLERRFTCRSSALLERLEFSEER